MLDSCGVGHLGSHLLIAGICLRRVLNSRKRRDSEEFDKRLESPDHSGFFTFSYDLGRKLLNVGTDAKGDEPDLFYASFDCIVVHDYTSGETFLSGNKNSFARIEGLLRNAACVKRQFVAGSGPQSNFTRESM